MRDQIQRVVGWESVRVRRRVPVALNEMLGQAVLVLERVISVADGGHMDCVASVYDRVPDGEIISW